MYTAHQARNCIKTAELNEILTAITDKVKEFVVKNVNKPRDKRDENKITYGYLWLSSLEQVGLCIDDVTKGLEDMGYTVSFVVEEYPNDKHNPKYGICERYNLTLTW
jgi:hypothetical protein